MARGTTRKFGIPRYESGRAKPPKKEPDQGNDGLRKRRERYGGSAHDDQTGDAIGRAYTNRLLGNFARGKLDFARADCERYWRSHGQFASMDSVVRASRPRGQAVPKRLSQGTETDTTAKYDEERLELLAVVDAAVAKIVDAKFPYFELVRNWRHADQGPDWLDAVIDAQRGGTLPPAGARHMLRLALAALDAAFEAVGDFKKAA